MNVLGADFNVDLMFAFKRLQNILNDYGYTNLGKKISIAQGLINMKVLTSVIIRNRVLTYKNMLRQPILGDSESVASLNNEVSKLFLLCWNRFCSEFGLIIF